MDNIFKDNPGLDVAYKTADGKYFYTENGAQNYALTLKNQEVKKVVRLEDRETLNTIEEGDKTNEPDIEDKTNEPDTEDKTNNPAKANK